MKKLLALSIIISLISILYANGMQEAIDKNSDSVYVANSKLGFSIEVAGKADDFTLSVPSQLLYFLPLEKSDNTLSSKELGITFEGSFPGKVIFNQYSYSEELIFNTVSRNKTKYYERPQEINRPQRVEQEIEIILRDGAILSGTLTAKPNTNSNKVVVLISGSGSQDRDSFIANHKIFQVLSDSIITQDIATFRFDDRGVGKSTKPNESFTTYDLADDVREICSELKRLGYEDIILLGHSEGAIIASIIASSDSSIYATILLSPPAISGKEILIDQNRTAYQNLGVDNNTIESILSILSIAYDYLINQDSDSALKYLEMILGPSAKSTIKALETPWYRTFLALNPAEYMNKIHCPTLAILGTNDKQVSYKLNKEPLEDALGKENVLFLEGINHILQYSNSGNTDEYGLIEETVNENILNSIKEFLCTI